MATTAVTRISATSTLLDDDEVALDARHACALIGVEARGIRIELRAQTQPAWRIRFQIQTGADRDFDERDDPQRQRERATIRRARNSTSAATATAKPRTAMKRPAFFSPLK